MNAIKIPTVLINAVLKISKKNRRAAQIYADRCFHHILEQADAAFGDEYTKYQRISLAAELTATRVSRIFR